MSDYIEGIFGAGGLLARRFPGYETRPGQVALARAVDAAFTDGEHLLAEGPCGTGKSIAYLTPAVHHAVAHGKKVVIATANIALQEQLVGKDLPLLAEVLPEPFTFALMKGKNNFLCESRLYEGQVNALFCDFYEPDEEEQYAAICAWARGTETGDVSELSFRPRPGLWRKLCGDVEECDGEQCRKAECFAWQARERAKDAHVVVTNYHLLFAHLQVRAETGLDLILPAFDLAVCDEGHETAEIARDFFGFRVTEGALRRLVRPLLRADAGALASQIQVAAAAFFETVQTYARSPRYKARLKEPGFVDGGPVLAALDAHQRFWSAREAAAEDEEQARRIARRLARAGSLRARIEAALRLDDENFVYWIAEDEHGRVILAGKPIDVAPYLREELFAKTESVVVTSATLTTGGTFDFVRQQVGIEGGRELAVESPFDFREQVLLVVPEMACEPNSPSFAGEMGLELARVLDLVGGRTLGLFTSYRNLHAVHERIAGTGHRILIQGDRPRTQLVREFTEDIASVLLGMTSFWTGIDVPGESLTCLAIDRLPFPTPDDPVMDAICERDKRWFARHSIPRAVIALRQGFGRLIRARTDHGVVVIFDRRLIEKPYGKVFLRSLPECRRSRKLESIARFLGLEEEVCHDPYA
ncbi:MAG: DEAD/DEAH box helicase family protein [Trueperaceae bacterium]|nr:DEAD/DEAH box helicase family protein [Trueperaceae bacterium]